MLRLWAESYTRRTPLLSTAALSVVVHGLLIGGAVVATLPADNVPEGSLANRVFYIPPPDRVAGQSGSRQTIRYIDLTRVGIGVGNGPAVIGNDRPLKIDQPLGTPPKDTTNSVEREPVPGPPDSVFSVLEVDSAVVRASNSAAPAYPLKLLQAHITGTVLAEYIVDTTGFADTASFKVLNAANPAFVTAVRTALPYMRFSPAKIGKTKVRQLVQQPFTFRIADSVTASPTRKP